jgi:putative component of membrane protein insertase Oxa1/YidC/SpoIIIJ protein YidD
MTTAVLGGLAVSSIGLYQRYISPYKGFRCAHRAASGKLSCSAFGKRAFAKYNVTTALALLDRRLKICRASFQALKDGQGFKTATAAGGALAASAVTADSGDASEAEARKKKEKSENYDCACDGADLGGRMLVDAAQSLSCDVGICDCSL